MPPGGSETSRDRERRKLRAKPTCRSLLLSTWSQLLCNLRLVSACWRQHSTKSIAICNAAILLPRHFHHSLTLLSPVNGHIFGPANPAYSLTRLNRRVLCRASQFIPPLLSAWTRVPRHSLGQCTLNISTPSEPSASLCSVAQICGCVCPSRVTPEQHP